MTELIPTIATAVFWAATLSIILPILGTIYHLLKAFKSKDKITVTIPFSFWQLFLFLTIYILSILLK